MKNLAILIFLSISLSSFSQDKATIFFIRNTGPSPSKFKVFIDNDAVCKLPQRRYSIHELRPGTHTFWAQLSGTRPKERAKRRAVTIECVAGKTYYVTLVLRKNYRGTYHKVFCEEITENSWRKLYSDLPVQENCRIE